MKFKEKVALITGAGSGIGKETALALAKEGAKIMVSDINEETGQQTVDAIKELGQDAMFIKANVAKYEEVEKMVEATVAAYGRIDIAINNAGIGSLPARTADKPLKAWDRVMAVNASGVFYGMKLQIQQMMKQGGGVIVNTASVAGLKGLPNNIAYTASKHAVVGMTKAAAMEYAQRNIRINAVCPAFTTTALFDPEEMDKMKEGISEKLKAFIPMKRFGNVSEISDAILWLVSDQASFVTGQALAIDGGLTA